MQYSQDQYVSQQQKNKEGAANAIAVLGTIYVAPVVYEFSEPLARKLLTSAYGEDLAAIGVLIHAVATLAITFFGIRSATLILLGMLATATARYSYGLLA